MSLLSSACNGPRDFFLPPSFVILRKNNRALSSKIKLSGKIWLLYVYVNLKVIYIYIINWPSLTRIKYVCCIWLFVLRHVLGHLLILRYTVTSITVENSGGRVHWFYFFLIRRCNQSMSRRNGNLKRITRSFCVQSKQNVLMCSSPLHLRFGVFCAVGVESVSLHQHGEYDRERQNVISYLFFV